MIITVPSFNLSSIGPWLTLTIAAIFILLLDAFSPKGRKSIFPILALLALAVAAWQTYCLWGKVGLDFSRMVYLDNFAFYFYLIIILGTALTILLSPHYLEEFGKNIGEYYALVLFAAVGMLLMAASAHFIMIFLGLLIEDEYIYLVGVIPLLIGLVLAFYGFFMAPRALRRDRVEEDRQA